MILGGAALTRAYVEDDLAALFDGEVRYARDAFEGLALMEPLVKIARGADPAAVGLPALKKRRHAAGSKLTLTEPEAMPARSDVASDNPVPAPPFWGTRIVRGIALHDYAAFLDERATFMGQWGLKPGRGEDGASYEQLVDTEGRPRLRYWLDRILGEGMLDASVAYGYFPVVSEGNDVVVLHHGDDPRRCARERRACSRPTAAPAASPAPSGCGSTSRASAATATCASPTSSARASRAPSTCCPCSS